MILAVTLIIGALATYWATATAGSGAEARARRLRIFRRRCSSPQCSAALCTRWARFGRSLPFCVTLERQCPVRCSSRMADFGWAGGLACYCSRRLRGGKPVVEPPRLSDRWRTYGFPSVVAAIYVTLNVISFVTDEIGGWSQASLWNYALLPLHCVAVFASWIVYLMGMGRWVAAP